MFYLTTHSTHFFRAPTHCDSNCEDRGLIRVLFYRGSEQTRVRGSLEGRKEMFYLTTHSTHFFRAPTTHCDSNCEDRGLIRVLFYRGSEQTRVRGSLEGRKEMFYLTTHSTHFFRAPTTHCDSNCEDRGLIRVLFYRGSEQTRVRGSLEGRKEMFYLTTHSTHFYLRLYGVRRMVEDHSHNER